MLFTHTPYSEPLRQTLAQPQPDTHDVALYWLGQAGFAVKYQETVLFIDPYLSDSLAKKYAGGFFPHTRMTPAPIAPDEVRHLDLLLCTHGHTDHLDPDTVSALARGNCRCVVVVPAAAREQWEPLDLPAEQVRPVNAGQQLCPADGICIEVLPAAHEEFHVNERGEYPFLGYLLKLGELTVYHSGDCVPYPGLADTLRGHAIDLALLPVNGRDTYRQEHGVVGNFTLPEAVDLCKQAEIPYFLGHHFDMFECNTIDADQARQELRTREPDPSYSLVQTGTRYLLSR